MLIVYRSEYQTVHIGEDIIFKVFEVEPKPNGRGYDIRIGIKAPKELLILRGELLDKDKEDKENGTRRK